MTEEPSIDPEKTTFSLVNFIREQLAGSGRDGLVVGLSGGLDSATATYLGARAAGPGNLRACIMPYSTTSRESIEDAILVAEELGLEYDVIDITPMVDSYFHKFPDAGRKRQGNYMARIRMAVLYDQSEVQKALVLGTGNRTEILLGYTTLWGDMACAFTPLGGLYKTQVRQLAAYLGVPARIIKKPPSAELWPGQTDEGEMGLTYEEADRLLYCMIDLGHSDARLEEDGFSPSLIARVRHMMAASAFKRRLPPHP